MTRPRLPSAHPHGVREALVIRVDHLAAPQGSKRHVGRGIMVESSKRTRPYRDAVHAAALDAITAANWQTLTGPVRVYVHFWFPRPKSHYRTGRNAHLVRDGAPFAPDNRGTGDIDKLVRATLDGLASKTGAGVFGDDAQVCDLRAAKTWGTRPEVCVMVEPMAPFPDRPREAA